MTFQPTDRILIIGGSGFIGCHLLKRCLKDTVHVACLGLHAIKTADILESRLEYITCDIADASSVRELLQHRAFEYVFNLGGYIDHTPYGSGGRKVIDTHFGGLLNLVDTLDRASLKGFVQIGSSDEYGNISAPQIEEMQGIPISPYSLAKQMGSAFLMMLAERESYPAIVARLFLVYGPGQEDCRFLPQVILSCLKGKEIAVTLGEQLRDFCFVEDVVEGLVVASQTREARGRIFNIASGASVSVREMMDTVVKLVGKGKPLYGARPYREGESMALYADISKARNILRWQPTTDLLEGLKKTIPYYEGLPT